jgi:hypothetical protein
MRRILITAAVAALVATGCITPPSSTNPYACADEPVDLGPGSLVAMSDDGQVLVVRTAPLEGDGLRYEVVDRRRGQRHDVVTTSPSGDGAALFMDAAGTRIYGLRYPVLAEGESAWFLHDVASRVTLDIAPIVPDGWAPFAFSDDLATAVLDPATGATWELLDVGTGARTPTALLDDPAWRTGSFSGDLSLAAQYSSVASTSKTIRIVDVATGAVVRELRVSNESSSYVRLQFVAPGTVLVTDAVPFGSPPDAVADDGAFLLDVSTGAITRLDPGVPRSSTYAASPDGRRTMYWALSPLRTEIRIDGVAQQLADINSGVANADLSVVVSGGGGSLLLRCFP